MLVQSCVLKLFTLVVRNGRKSSDNDTQAAAEGKEHTRTHVETLNAQTKSRYAEKIAAITGIDWDKTKKKD